MQAVFNGPLTSNDFQQSGGAGLFKGQAGYPIDSFSAFFAGWYLYNVAFEAKDLLDMGKVYVAVEFFAVPNGAFFQTAMAFIDCRFC